MSEIERLGVVGAGFMGSGIAESCARAGLEVVVFEPEGPPLERSRAGIERSIARAVGRGKLAEEDGEALVDRITWTTEIEDLQRVDGVVEAIIEDARVKGSLFKKLDALLPDARFLASNTSSIPIAEIASWTRRPERVLGLHFFSPVPVMSLVEIVVGYDTHEDVVALAEDLSRDIGKHPVITKDRSGFIVNFLLVPYLMAAIRMFQDGFAAREDIDEAMKQGCGHPMGPLTLADFIGLDVLYAIGDSLYEEFKQPEYAPPPLLKRMVVSGAHGRKSGRGFYDYDSAPTPTKAIA
ncbi:3-hydroxybutyryl-CoA dehydrogenase [Conexibacter sp. W3-3-2]|uniref:3-hydroxybutyryl-CoA dehydrogenase n=1 Tax=Paraconexibacter algicola TaxID=2133960 RepID=A0A2T4UG78_9ACTN|nr:MULTISPECIES: 3-hydroxybutyryl-CoA dehydrogenase [Solirubrobacterales]MTD44474.1 3-hydroxybutyryl-CoA dehydrogenase [Conexibacter sp. W3-3-2]PTL58230.1 3-hydroxybutyryl-CoA dehydrogenase [Paraconexibacter algicola]